MRPRPPGPGGSAATTVLIAVCGVALVARVWHVLSLVDAPFFTHLLGDAEGYDRWARILADGDWLGAASGVFYQAPLYPYALGTAYAIVGRDLLAVRLVQAGLGALSCGLVTLATMEWFGRRAALPAGLLLACYGPALFLDAMIQKSILDGLLVSGLLLALARARRSPTWQHSFLLGSLLGLLTLNRENALVLLPVIALAVWQSTGRRSRGPVAVTVLATALILAPAAIRNRVIGGELHLTTSQLGPNFYIGNNPSADGTYVPLRQYRGSFEFERRDATELANAATGRELNPSEVSRYWLREGLAWIRAEPRAWLRLTGRKLLLLVNGTEAADTEDLTTHAEWSIVLRVLGSTLQFGTLVPLALLGVWVSRNRWRDLWPLAAFGCVFAASVVMFYVLDRYRYPLVPLLAMFAGAGVAGARASWVRSGVAERVIVVALVAVAAVVCRWPILSTTDMRAVTHYNAGARLQKDGLDAQAEVEYRRSLALRPTLASAHSNLCALLTGRGSTPEALAQCHEAVRLDPTFAAAHVNLGMILAQTAGPDAALEEFVKAVQLDPVDAGAHYNLGRALASMGRTEAATEHLREAIRLEPSTAPPYNTLGALLCSAGRLDEGIPFLRTAVRLDPFSADAVANLQHALELERKKE